MDAAIHHFDPHVARQLLLVRAIDESDVQSRLVSAAEREQAEHEALRESRAQAKGGRWDAATFLQLRARRILALVDGRQPRLASLQHEQPWREWLAWALPISACLLGAAIDRIDNPHQVNMLSPPLLAVVVWNLFVYLLIVATPLVPASWRARMPWTRLRDALGGWGGWPRRSGNLRADVAMRFNSTWLAATAVQQRAWAGMVLHASAAGWAFGLGISIVLGGLVREYRVGWESTLLDLPQVHALLSALFAPVVALLPFESFTMGELQRMHFASNAVVGVQEARHWVWLYLSLLGLVVVLPRVVLAAAAFWRITGSRTRVRLDLGHPYFADLLARVAPASIVVGVPAGNASLLHVLRKAESLKTAREDEFRAVELHGTVSGAKLSDPAIDLVLDAGERDTERWTRTWMHESALRDAIAERLPAAKAGGFARIAAQWAERDNARFTEAMRIMARGLIADACETEEVRGVPRSLRSLWSREESNANQEAQLRAVESMSNRLQVRDATGTAALVALHGVDTADAPALAARGREADFRVPQAIDSPQAGFAGAASGAAMGAGIDMITGGLTLGAATALGALVGGAFGYTAAHFRNRSAPSGVAQIQLGDEMLQTEVENALLLYLVVIHWGRPAQPLDGVPASWRSETVAAVEAARDRWAAIWADARADGADAHELTLRAAHLLEETARRVMLRI